MLKILYIADLNIRKGGGQRRAYEVIRRVAKFNETHLISYGAPLITKDLLEHISLYSELPRFDKASIWNISSFLSSLGSYLRVIKEAITNLKPDIVVVTGEWMYPINLALYVYRGQNLEVPLVFTVHEVPIVYTISWNQYISDRIFERIVRSKSPTSLVLPLLFQISINTLKKYNILCVGFGAKYYIERVGIRNGIVIHPPNGIDVNYIKEKTSCVGKEDIPTIVFMAARLNREKGVNDFVEIFKVLRRRIRAIKAYVMGKFDPSCYDLLEKIRRYPQIEYLGFVDEETKYKILAKSWLMIYPSRQDAFSISVLEALACGTPVVAYDIPGITLNYRYCDAVITVKFGAKKNMIEEASYLITDKECLRDLWQKAIKYGRRYSWEKVAEAEYKAYLDFLARQ